LARLSEDQALKAYLDNDVVSAIVKDDNEAESDALDRLLAAYRDGKVDLVTSKLTQEEIDKYQGPLRPAMERIFRFLKEVPIVRHDELLGIHSYGDERTWINTPMIQNYTLYDALLKLKLKGTYDPLHVFMAAKNGCDIFLTIDGGIRARSAEIKQLCGLDVMKPSDFVAKQGW